MRTRRIAIVGGALVALAAGTGGAIAATQSDDAKEHEQTILDTAAKKLDVTPEQLRDALKAGRTAEIDKLVADGKLTKDQADEIKKRMEASGLVLGGPGGRGGPGGGHGFRGMDGGGPREMGADLAKALGLSEAELRKQFEAGKTIAEIAKAQSKDLDDVKAAVKKVAVARLDAQVKAGKLTDAQRDEIAKRLDERIDHLGEGPMGRRGPGGPHGGPGMPPPRQEGETQQDGSYVPPAVGSTETS
ncbi:MAG: hypothetical protein JHC95_00155 [Solirubrobacteraceae bacterium]|nr:hypothetical protein [Solirubrobacteraceae bacterium]